MPVIHCIFYQCLCIDMFYCQNGLNMSVLPVPNCLTCSTDVVCLLADMASCFWPSVPPHSVPVPVPHLSQWIMGMSLCMAISVKMVTMKKKNSFMYISVLFILSLCLSGPSWFVFCSLKCSQCQKPRQPREMTLQWMWTSHLL